MILPVVIHQPLCTCGCPPHVAPTPQNGNMRNHACTLCTHGDYIRFKAKPNLVKAKVFKAVDLMTKAKTLVTASVGARAVA